MFRLELNLNHVSKRDPLYKSHQGIPKKLIKLSLQGRLQVTHPPSYLGAGVNTLRIKATAVWLEAPYKVFHASNDSVLTGWRMREKHGGQFLLSWNYWTLLNYHAPLNTVDHMCWCARDLPNQNNGENWFYLDKMCVIVLPTATVNLPWALSPSRH